MTPAAPAATTATGSPVADEILSVDGESDAVTALVEVVSGWQIRWRTEGATFRIAVTGDQDLGAVLDQPGPASGVTSLPVSGTFKLEITAEGPWSISVIQGAG